MRCVLEVEVLGLGGLDGGGRRKKSGTIPSLWPQARPWCWCSRRRRRGLGEVGWVESVLWEALILRPLLDTEVAALSRQLSGSLREVLSGEINWRAITLDEITLGAKDI